MRIKEYVQSVIQETKAIVFPPRRRVAVDSSIVVAALIVGGVVVGLVDAGFGKGIEQLTLLIQK